MGGNGAERRLAAILFTDMKGYSRQMDEDEAGTLARLQHHNAILRECLEGGGGRVIKTVGDAFMAEFRSAVSAVEAALEVQRRLAAHNAGVSEAEAILVRIGVHVGDVVEQEGDLFGEAVNVAARLEPQALVGGVCVSEPVFRQVRRRVHAASVSLGKVALKNISEPLELHCLSPADTLLDPPSLEPVPGPPRRRVLLPLVGGLALSLLALGWWRLPSAQEAAPPTKEEAEAVLRLATTTPPTGFNVNSVSHRLDVVAGLGMVTDPLVTSESSPLRGVIERIESSEDGLEAWLHLRPGPVFHPHPCLPGGGARPAVPADLAWSLQFAVRDPMMALPIVGAEDFLAGRSERLEGVEVSEAGGPVHVRLSRPFRALTEAISRTVLIPTELEGCDDPQKLEHPVGTGPYRFVPGPEAGRFSLVRWERYWQPLPPPRSGRRPERIEVLRIADPIEAVGRVALGEVDLFWISSGDVAALLADPAADLPALRPELQQPGLRVFLDGRSEFWTLGTLIPMAGRTGGPLEDARLRRAVANAIDREALAAKVPGLGQPTGRILSSNEAGYHTDIQPQRRDPQLVARLLEEAGHPGWEGLPELLLGDRGGPTRGLSIVRDQLAEVGIRARVVDVSRVAWDELHRQGLVDLVSGVWSEQLLEGEPLWVMNSLTTGVGGQTFLSPRLREMGQHLHTLAEREERLRYYPELEQAILDEALIIPIAWPHRFSVGQRLVVGPRVAGVGNPVSRRVELGRRVFGMSLLGLGVAEPDAEAPQANR
ncbi:MAG: ABC transporter substrate-binding protein [Deltaproteobacteria bacterium]|nr:ABC transporter substrate-binding protein [Deltaproteobacteria bacterium]